MAAFTLLLMLASCVTTAVVAQNQLKAVPYKSKCKPAAMANCKLNCMFGLRIESGCLICACHQDPCKWVTCPKKSQICKAVDVNPGFPPKKAKCLERYVPARCQEVLEAGPCLALHFNYYYDTTEHICKKFAYGGCRGNQNRFLTAQDCRRVCIDEPEHAMKYPNCTALPPRCLNYCKFGHALDSKGCPSCSCAMNPCRQMQCQKSEICRLKNCYGPHNCQNGKPVCMPRCKQIKEICNGVTCRFGYKKGGKGCPTCQCLPDPCQSHVCPEFQECIRNKDNTCIFAPCSFLPACTEIKRVSHINVEMRMLHQPHLYLHTDKLKQKLREQISKWLGVQENEIITLELKQDNKEQFTLKFSVRTSADVDLAKKYYNMKTKLYENHLQSSLRYEGSYITADVDSLQGEQAKTEDDHSSHHMFAVAAGALCGVLALAILLVVVIVFIKRRRHALYRGSSNVPYKGMSIKSSIKDDRVAIM